MSDLTVFKYSLRELARPKRIAVALLLVAIPALLALLIKTQTPAAAYRPDDAYGGLMALVVFGFLLVILAVVFFTGIIAQEIEQKTIVYLLTRPIPRWRLLLIKYCAAVIAVTLIGWASSVVVAFIIYGPSGIGGSALTHDLAIVPVGVLAYGAVFLALATLLNRPLIYGLLFAFGWESWAPLMPGSLARYSILVYVRVLAPHIIGSAPPVPPMIDPITTGEAWRVLIELIVVGLGVAIAAFSMKEYSPREDTE